MGARGQRQPTRVAKQTRPDVPGSIVPSSKRNANSGTKTYTLYSELGYGGEKNCRQDPGTVTAGRAMATGSTTTARRRRRADVGTTTMAQWWRIGTGPPTTTRPRPGRRTRQIGAVQKPSASRS